MLHIKTITTTEKVMKEEYARMIADMNCEVTLYEDYSGRGMYGDTTFGVSGESYELGSAAVDALDQLMYDAEDVDEARQIAKEFARDVFRGRRDNMGLGEIWY
jgi:hypothetical protein